MDKRSGDKRPVEKKRPQRYKLYDRLSLSVGTVNAIIYALIGLIVLAVLVGTFVR